MSPQQWTLFEQAYTGSTVIFFSTKRVDALLEIARAHADGRAHASDYFKLDPTGPSDFRDVPVPDFLAFDAFQLSLLTEVFIQDHALDDSRAKSARALLREIETRYRESDRAANAVLQRMWHDICVAFVAPQESRAPRHEAIRAMWRQSCERIDPLQEELSRRLDELLTTAERQQPTSRAVRPEWLELTEIAMKAMDARSRASASSQPTTQPVGNR